ncbi:MAG: 2-keto-4-pentenoate hydratase [Alphaproteobacteria bacterium]
MAERKASRIAGFARTLDEAQRTARPVAQISTAKKPMELADAYAIQAAAIARRLRRGERRSGAKLGFTSRAKAAQMGVFDVIYGRLTDAMLLPDGGIVDLARFVHPRVEPEVAFLLARPLRHPVSPAEAMAAVGGIAPALEIIDSRYENFKFSLADVVADNCSGAGYVLGQWHAPTLDISNLGMVLEFDGRAVEIASSAAILGHPARSLVEAARFAAERGDRLEAGFVIMAGGATAAAALKPGLSVRVVAQHLGEAGFRCRA